MTTSRGSSRPLMFLASSVWVALLLSVLVFRAGTTAPGEPRPEPAGLGLAEPAAALTQRGDHEGAWRLYYQALQAAPDDVSLWYALGVTLSHLNRQQETEEAFRYVVRQGSPGSEEVRLARQWLIKAGVLAEPVTFTSTPGPVDGTSDTAVVQGQTTWGTPHPNGASHKLRLLLHGVDGAAEGTRFKTEVALGQVYRFEHLRAGSYRLLGRAGDHLLWDLTVVVEEGKTVTQELSKENSHDPAVALDERLRS